MPAVSLDRPGNRNISYMIASIKYKNLTVTLYSHKYFEPHLGMCKYYAEAKKKKSLKLDFHIVSVYLVVPFYNTIGVSK